MKVLVTGATGFVGSALARILLIHGYDVRALSRPQSDTRTLEAAGVEIVRGDLLDPDSLATATRGADGVFHCAAEYTYWARDRQHLYRSNVDGTLDLVHAAARAGVSRFVFTSTVATLKWPGPNRLADEQSLAALEDMTGHYKRSKWLAERAVLDAAGQGMDVIVVNPTAPFGPGDARPTPTGRIVLEFLGRRRPGYVDTGVNVVDVDDVADGHRLAFERGVPGERYILGGENMTIAEVYGILNEITGLRRRPLRIPFTLAFALGYLDFMIEHLLLRRTPYVPLEGLRVARKPMYVTREKARAYLGVEPRPAAAALERSVRWYADNGYASLPGRLRASAEGMEAVR